MNRLRRFLRLPHRLQRLATVVLFMAPRVNRRVRKAGYEATTDWLNRREQPTVEDLDKAIRTARIAQTVTAHMPGSYNCLTRSLIVWWLIAAASSESAFMFIDGLLRSWLGSLVLLLATWALFFHMLGRLRHLIWDLGYAVEVQASEKMAIGMFVLATVFTIITIILV